MVRKATQRLKCRPRQGGGQQELQQAASSRRRHQARIAHRDGKRKGALYNEVAAQPRGGKSADPRWRAGGRGGAPMCRGLCSKASSADPELRRLRRGSTEPTTCKDLSCSPFPHLTGHNRPDRACVATRPSSTSQQPVLRALRTGRLASAAPRRIDHPP